MLQVFLPEIEYADETYSEKNNTCCIYIKSAPLDYCIAVIPFTGNYGIENVMPLLINLCTVLIHCSLSFQKNGCFHISFCLCYLRQTHTSICFGVVVSFCFEYFLQKDVGGIILTVQEIGIAK